MNALRIGHSFVHSTFVSRAAALGALSLVLFLGASPAHAGHRGGFSIRFSTPRNACAAPAPRFAPARHFAHERRNFEWRPACNAGPAWGSWEHGQLVGTEHGEWQGYRDGLEGRGFCDDRRIPLDQYPRAFIEGYQRALHCAYGPAYRRGERDRRNHCH